MEKRSLEAVSRWGKNVEEEETNDKWGNKKKKLEPGEAKEKANFGLSGTLNKDSKTGKLYNGVVMKWSEPADAATPTGPGWRIYVFKNDDLVDTLYLHRQSAFLISRDKTIADLLVEHPSCSKQHAVIQFRIKTQHPPPGSMDQPKYFIRPYIMDLESTNGTFLNSEKVERSRYIELLEKDVLKFGESSREYVLMFTK